jgi:outer membrane protein assembly factor BamA
VPFPLWILHTGFVLFYDAGAAFKEWRSAYPTQSIGVGLRVLAPQISSELFRFDLGFPIYGPRKRDHVVVPSLGLGQAF